MSTTPPGPYQPAADLDDLDAIAIIGMAGRFPDAENIEQFWRNLSEGVESISPVSLPEMLEAGVDRTAALDPHRVAVASTIAGVERFDAGFFDISPRQAELTDPQHRVFLECSWEALESAGYDPAAGSPRTGVFAGSSLSTYLLHHLYPAIAAADRSSDLQLLIGNDKDYLATQVAYKLGLKGPAINVQTACSTSLVAVHLACQSLLNRECDLALAGGVTVRLPARAGYRYEEGGILSPDGHCRPFDAGAQGTVFGSGAGVVVLKRLAEALVDGDVIDAVIRGSAINNDGSLKAGFTAPSEDGQAEVVAEALAIAEVAPETIRYVETHGTGTPLGDPIEHAALERAFRARAGGRSLPPGSCALGAVKSNVGHTESAAGAAGLIKTVLALTHRQIPPTLHFSTPNPAIDFTRSPFYVNTRLSPWPAAAAVPRRAGVSSFGIGGTNAHVVLEEAPAAPVSHEPDASPAGGATERPYLLPLSARDPAALAALAGRYRDLLAADGTSPHDVCWSASRRRRHHDYRWAVVARSRDELVARLAAAAGEDAGAAGTARAGHRPRLVFVFPGQGSQWLGMGRQLLAREPAFRTALERCDQVIRRHTGWSPLAELTGDGDQSWWERTDRVQLALFAVQVGLAAWWRSLGVEPDAVLGHSLGEIAAAHVAGALSLDDAVRIVHHRNRLIEQVVGEGRMLATGLTPDQAREHLAGHEARAAVAIVNSPRSTVLSGDAAVLEQVAARLQDQGTFHRWVNVDFASHSPQMAPLSGQLEASLSDIHPSEAAVTIVSTVTGTPVEATELDAGYWARNLREPVRFAGATRWLREHDHDVFLEISPHPILLPAIEDTLYHLERPGTVVPSLRRDADEQQALLEALSALYRAGQPIQWDLLYPQGGRYVRLPAYPWQRERHWVDPPRYTQDMRPAAGTSTGHPLLGRRLRSPLTQLQYESELDLTRLPYLADHRVCGRAVFPATGYLEILGQAAADWAGHPVVLREVALTDLLAVSDEQPRRLLTVLTPAGDGEGLVELFSWDQDSETWRRHVTARAGAGGPADEPAPSELAEVRDRCPREMPVSEYYDRLHEQGLEYGPRFRGIESLRIGCGEVLGQVRLPEALVADAGSYHVHPALLDASLQLIGAAFAAGDGGGGGGAGQVYLPVGIATYRVAVPGQSRLVGHARVPDQAGDGSRTGDVRLYDEQGQLVAEVLGLRVKPVSRAVLHRMIPDPANTLDSWRYEVRWHRRPSEEAAGTTPAGTTLDGAAGDRWLILADRGGVGQALADRLARRGAAATLVFPATGYRRDGTSGTFHIDLSNPDDLARLLAEAGAYRDVVYLWALDTAPVAQTTAETLSRDEELACGGALHLAQALVRRAAAWPGSSRLWLVTRGAVAPTLPTAAPAPVQAPLWGLGGALALEHPDLPCHRVDLDPAGTGDDALSLLAEADAAARGGQEDQVAFRAGERFVARLVRSPRRAGTPVATGEPVRLAIATRGNLDALAFAPALRRTPAAGEVEIRVRATGLNFRDVMGALGTYPGDPGPLGVECAGEITAVGDGVDEFRVGDPVVALAQGSFGTYVTVPAVFAAGKPESLSYAEAATIPISFLTAYYGLVRQARISRGDTILIHAAAGGLGLAATQLALRAGAEVFGTAGSDQKRSYLRSLGLRHVLPSRTLDFATEVRERTGGRGVDLVLNALAGEYIPRNLSILAGRGRFVEVGKIGIWDAEQVGQVRPDVSYSVVDLDLVARRDPELVGGMLRDLMRDFAQGTLRPLPRQVFGLPEVTDAFRFMAQARHIGKVVVTQEVGLSGPDPDRVRADASYLITGGLGGLGLQVARWLVGQGARHLALVGRGSPTAAAQSVVDELTGAGAQVLVIGADVAHADQVSAVLAELSAAMPPLRGIVHVAGVLDDGILLHQRWARFAGVLAPKVQGAWNLHASTRHVPLDFFVMFSSIASVFGAAGQSSYAAGNSFLDALAHARRAYGLPALSINWGGWSRVGLAARDQVADRMSGHGMSAIAPEDGVAALDRAMHQSAAQLVVVPVDWAAYLAQLPGGRVPPMLAELSHEARRPAGDRPGGEPGGEPDVSGSSRSALLRRLDATGPDNRRRALASYLDEQAKRALGLGPTERLDPRQPLNERGLDSLMAIEMRSRLSHAVGQTLPATVLFDYPTVEALTGYLAEEVLGLPGGQHEPAEPEPAEPGSGATELTPDEVEAFLAEELAAVQTLLSGDRP